MKARPVDVELDAEHHVVDLPVVADEAAIARAAGVDLRQVSAAPPPAPPESEDGVLRDGALDRRVRDLAEVDAVEVRAHLRAAVDARPHPVETGRWRRRRADHLRSPQPGIVVIGRDGGTCHRDQQAQDPPTHMSSLQPNGGRPPNYACFARTVKRVSPINLNGALASGRMTPSAVGGHAGSMSRVPQIRRQTSDPSRAPITPARSCARNENGAGSLPRRASSDPWQKPISPW